MLATEENNHEMLHPLQNEMLHDDQTTAIFKLAMDLERASIEPTSDNRFNPYHKFMEVKYNYVGDPDPEKRKGIHYLPDVTRETTYGTYNYNLGVAAVFDPKTANLCVVRNDPNKPKGKARGWMVISYNILSGQLTEEIVQDVVIQGDAITLDIVSNSNNNYGINRLSFSVDHDYVWDGKPITLTGDSSYGRTTNQEYQEYSVDIGDLCAKIEEESKYRADDKRHKNEQIEPQAHSKDFYQFMGHIADKAA